MFLDSCCLVNGMVVWAGYCIFSFWNLSLSPIHYAAVVCSPSPPAHHLHSFISFNWCVYYLNKMCQCPHLCKAGNSPQSRCAHVILWDTHTHTHTHTHTKTKSAETCRQTSAIFIWDVYLKFTNSIVAYLEQMHQSTLDSIPACFYCFCTFQR